MHLLNKKTFAYKTYFLENVFRTNFELRLKKVVFGATSKLLVAVKKKLVILFPYMEIV